MFKYSREEKYTKPKNAKELLTLARAKEKGSFGFYSDMSGYNFSEDIKKLIEELKNEELDHIRRIEAKLEQLKGTE
jgi:rubrerythrin